MLDIEPTEKNINKELGLLLMALYEDFRFVHQRLYKRNKQLTCNTSHLRGIAWSSGKLEVEKLFLVLRHEGNECRIVC